MSINKLLKQKIALFGGSFDPVHTDHLNIAIACHDLLGFDEVWFIPTFLNPFKKASNASKTDRLAMLQIATKDYEWMKINEYEINQEKPSYTYETLKHFVSADEYMQNEFEFIMGSDQLDTFEQWDQFKELINLVDFKVFKRSDDYNQEVVNKYHLEVFDFNRVGLSSTMIRNLEGLKEQIPAVNDYINDHLLYLNERVESQMDEERFQHCLNVGQMAAELAKKHGLDEHKALVAGTLHDVTKRWTEAKAKSYLEEYLPDLVDEPTPVWHSFTGAMHLKYDWLFHDNEIIDAVMNHTVGRPEMSAFEKVIFCADKISRERDYVEVEALRKLCFEDLDQGFIAVLKQAYNFALENHDLNTIGKMMQQTYDYYVKEGQ